MNDPAITFLKKCIELYSPSGHEKQFSEFLEAYLNKFGFNTKFDKVGNLIAEKGSGKPTLLLISHMDTIPGELPVFEENGKIFGRGAVDCKPALAAMIYSLGQLDFEKDIIGKVIFSGIVHEEDSLLGIEQFIKSEINPDFAIFGEPTRIDQICIGYKGRLCIGFKVISETGHVASSWEYINAVEVCLEIWNIIKGVCWQLTETYCPKNDRIKYFNKIIPTLTIISGGELTNCVPSECTFHVDIRFPPSINSEFALNEIRKKILNFKQLYETQKNKSFHIEESILSRIEGFEAKQSEMIIGALRWSIFKTLKKKPKLIKKTGTTFINAIGIHYGIPSITYGPGDPKLEHTVKEFIEIEEYLKSIEIYSKFFSKFYSMYHQQNMK
jgi:LysW-gamma-L-lysine carboxypeptidase